MQRKTGLANRSGERRSPILPRTATGPWHARATKGRRCSLCCLEARSTQADAGGAAAAVARRLYLSMRRHALRSISSEAARLSGADWKISKAAVRRSSTHLRRNHGAGIKALLANLNRVTAVATGSARPACSDRREYCRAACRYGSPDRGLRRVCGIICGRATGSSAHQDLRAVTIWAAPWRPWGVARKMRVAGCRVLFLVRNAVLARRNNWRAEVPTMSASAQDLSSKRIFSRAIRPALAGSR
jgi:hypothetical protein